MRFGQLPYDLSHLLAGLVLLLSFVLLYQRRNRAVIAAFAAQGTILALAAAWQGWVQDAAGLFLTALITFAAKGVLIPTALGRLSRRLNLHRGVQPALGIGPGLVLGVGLVGLSVVVVLPVTSAAGVLAREDLAIALSVVLLALLMMLTRRSPVGQAVGLLSLENGVILAAIGVQGMPLLVELSVAALVLAVALVAGFFAHLLRDGLPPPVREEGA
ncbi:hydrogenase-4 component E [Muricoccus radiodurans]|uniref:hydrogenase-4 component E n=1 Tax=Muricoccus radiodurans TaxID=2231721 RepID=UPI003CFAFE07